MCCRGWIVKMKNLRDSQSPHQPTSSRPHAMQTSRRQFLRAAGVSLALPWFDAFAPTSVRGAAVAGPPRRMICICAPLGFYPGDFFPKETGKSYELSPHLEVLREYRDEF